MACRLYGSALAKIRSTFEAYLRVTVFPSVQARRTRGTTTQIYLGTPLCSREHPRFRLRCKDPA